MHDTSVLTIETPGKSLVEFTREAASWVNESGVGQGLLTLFCRHTSASLLIQENAASEVQDDLLAHFERLAPESPDYAHDSEGPDDMPAHLKAAMTQTHLAIPIIDRRLALGTWQGIYLFEHRRRPHRREVVLHLAGD